MSRGCRTLRGITLLGLVTLFALVLPGRALAQPLQMLKLSSKPKELVLSSGGQVILIKDQTGNLVLWDTIETREVLTLRSEDYSPATPALSHDEDKLAVVLKGGKARIFDLRNATPKVLLEFGDARFTALAFGGEDRLLATGEESGRVRIWDAVIGRELPLFGQLPPQPAVRDVALADNAKLIAWETPAAVVASRLERKGNSFTPADPRFLVTAKAATPRLLAISGDGESLAVASGERVLIFSGTTGEKWPEFTAGADVIALRFNAFQPGQLGYVTAKGEWGVLRLTPGKPPTLLQRRPVTGEILKSAGLTADLFHVAFVDGSGRAGTALMKAPATANGSDTKKGPPKDKPKATDDPPKTDGLPKTKEKPPKINGPTTKSKDPPTKDPTTKKKEEEGVEVFFGTTRTPRTASGAQEAREQIWLEVFREKFFTSKGWWLGLRLGIVCLIPPLLIFCYLSSSWWWKAAGFVFALSLFFLLYAGFRGGEVRTWEPWFPLGIALLSFAVSLALLHAARNYEPLKGIPVPVKRWLTAVIWVAGTLFLWIVLAVWHAHEVAWEESLEKETPELLFTSEFSPKIEYGVCRVWVPPHRKPGKIEYPSGEGFTPRPSIDPDVHFYFLGIDRHPEDRFFGKLKEETTKEERELFIYIHGYNNSFREAAFRAAALKTDLGFKGPAVFFSWPARGYVEDYAADEEAVDLSMDLFEMFLKDVTEKSQADHVYLIAHSMGNRALTHALASLGKQKWSGLGRIQRVVFAAPDVNRDKFVKLYLPGLLKLKMPMTLYASNVDRALHASRTIHKSPRAGLAGMYMIPSEDPLETIDVSDMEGDFLGHDYAFSQKLVVSDLGYIWRKVAAPYEERELTRRLVEERQKEGPYYWTFKPRTLAGDK